jgi:hypothetical protein
VRVPGWRVLGSALTALTLLAGGVSVWSWLGRHDEPQQAVYDHDITRLVVDLAAGDVTLSAGPPGRVGIERHLTWSYGRPVVREAWSGSTLSIRAECDATPRLPGCGVSYRIEVPTGIAVDVHTGNGAVSVRDLTGPGSLASGHGPVRVAGGLGPLRISASDGDVTGTALTGSEVTASAGDGTVELTFAVAPAKVRAGVASSGDVVVTVPGPDGYNVHAGTRSGRRSIGVTQDPTAARIIDAETNNGDVRIAYGG